MPTNALKLADIKGQVWSVLHDAGSTITPDDIAAWVNEAQMDLASRLGLLHKKVTGTTAGSTLGLPPTPATQEQVLEIKTLRLGTDDDVEFTDDDVFHSWKDSGASSLEHTIARVSEGVIEMFPTPATGTAYELRYEYLPNPLASDNDTSSLPHHLHPRLVHYARAMGAYKMSMDAAGDRFYALYSDGLPPPELGRDKLTPGPLMLSVEPGPFDTTPYLDPFDSAGSS